MVFGSLHDPQGEFFIKKQQKKNIEASGNNRGSVNSLLDTSNSSIHSNASISSGKHHGSGGGKRRKDEKFYVDYAIVPSHFPVSLTDRILHIGSSVSILSNSESVFLLNLKT